MRNIKDEVSIPFKREGTFRLKIISVGRSRRALRFNSLQAGRHIQTQRVPCTEAGERGMFQFPSSGKAHSDKGESNANFSFELFQFPSSGKAHSDKTEDPNDPKSNPKGFNSLQAGRHIQTPR